MAKIDTISYHSAVPVMVLVSAAAMATDGNSHRRSFAHSSARSLTVYRTHREWGGGGQVVKQDEGGLCTCLSSLAKIDRHLSGASSPPGLHCSPSLAVA